MVVLKVVSGEYKSTMLVCWEINTRVIYCFNTYNVLDLQTT